jgi:hypothetical protein
MKVCTGSVQVQRDIHYVFDFITDFSNVEAMFEHIAHVVPAQTGICAIGHKFHQTRIVHGRHYREIVDVTALQRPTKYALRTSNFGVETIHGYTLEPIGDQATLVHLTKEAHGKGLSKLLLPLVYHLLTRPEHDGNHLNALKAALEQPIINA